MAKKDKKKVSRIKTKKKVWYKLIAPKLFGNKEIGESYLASAENAIGRKLKISLRDLTGSIRDQNVYIQFGIVKVEGSNLKTSVTGYQLTPAYVKRIVRKNVARLDDYFTLKTKEGKAVILKSLVVTLHRTRKSTKNDLRKQLHILLQEEIGKSEFDIFIGNLINGKIQSGIKKKLSKIFPVKEVAVRVLQLKTKKTSQPQEDVKVKDKVIKEPTTPAPNPPPLEEVKEEKKETTKK